MRCAVLLFLQLQLLEIGNLDCRQMKVTAMPVGRVWRACGWMHACKGKTPAAPGLRFSSLSQLFREVNLANSICISHLLIMASQV